MGSSPAFKGERAMKGIRKKVLRLRNRLYKAIMALIGKLWPMDRRKVVFDSFGGHAYSDNPRAVCDALLEISPHITPVWLFTRPEKERQDMPDRVKPVRAHSLAAVWHMATAGAWVLNGLMPHYAVKRKGQLYVQTWHGDRMFKVCLHNSGKHGLPDVDAMDFAVIGSDQGEMFFRTAFRYEGELLRVGSPRNDRLMAPLPGEPEKLRQRLGLEMDWGVALYAPTMREHLGHTKEKQDIGSLDFVRVLDLLEQKEGRPWRLLLRAHSTVSGLTGYQPDPRILDVSGYEDMRDLMIVADLLMTDYSSCACDFPLTGKPVVLFQPDLQQYQELDRKLYFKISDSPYWAASDQAGLESFLLDMDEEKARANSRAVLDFFGTDESGRAAAQVATRIAAHLEKD